MRTPIEIFWNHTSRIILPSPLMLVVKGDANNHLLAVHPGVNKNRVSGHDCGLFWLSSSAVVVGSRLWRWLVNSLRSCAYFSVWVHFTEYSVLLLSRTPEMNLRSQHTKGTGGP